MSLTIFENIGREKVLYCSVIKAIFEMQNECLKPFIEKYQLMTHDD